MLRKSLKKKNGRWKIKQSDWTVEKRSKPCAQLPPDGLSPSLFVIYEHAMGQFPDNSLPSVAGESFFFHV